MFEFRKYKIAQGKKKLKHPKLIVDDYKNEFGFMGLTHAKTKGKNHNNFPLIDNPKLDKDGQHLPNNISHGEENKNYLRRKVEYDEKENFGEILPDYSLSETDKKRVEEYISNKLKKH